MREISKRRMKGIKKCFEEKARWRKAREEKFLHRAPSGDARKKESVVSLIADRIDYLIIVSSFVMPPLKTGLIDRFLVLAGVEQVEPLIVLNKSDLLKSREEGEKTASFYRSVGYSVILTSIKTGEGIDILKSFITGNRSLLAGHSGVGKSSLLVAMYPRLEQEIATGEVSVSSLKGRHTTTGVKLLQAEGDTLIYDLPGLKYLSLHNMAVSDIQKYFPEIYSSSGRCRFSNCLHGGEPGCSVIKAVDDGIISKERYDSYLRILANPASME